MARNLLILPSDRGEETSVGTLFINLGGELMGGGFGIVDVFIDDGSCGLPACCIVGVDIVFDLDIGSKRSKCARNTRFRRRAKQKAPPEGGAKGSLHNCLDFDGMRKADNQIRRRVNFRSDEDRVFNQVYAQSARGRRSLLGLSRWVATAALRRDSCPD